MLGLRGVPQIQGGVEKHVEELSSHMVSKGWDVVVIGRKPYLAQKTTYHWQGVKIIPLWAPASMRFEAIIHTALGVLLAAFKRPDIVHIHAIGPALMVPLARLLGLKNVVTHHSFNYEHDKWGKMARRLLKLGEWAGMRFSNQRIGVSKYITQTMQQRYNVPVHYIPNGVTLHKSPVQNDVLHEFGLTKQRYVILVARIVAGKNQHDLITAFAKMQEEGKAEDFKLVLVGSADHKSDYADQVLQQAARTPGVVLTGMQRGDALASLFMNAALFVLPSSYEGMPIALLEAMGYGLPVLASDITANLELELEPEDYFPLGDIDSLADSMAKKLASPYSSEQAQAQIAQITKLYNWGTITDQTLAVYSQIHKKKQ